MEFGANSVVFLEVIGAVSFFLAFLAALGLTGGLHFDWQLRMKKIPLRRLRIQRWIGPRLLKSLECLQKLGSLLSG